MKLVYATTLIAFFTLAAVANADIIYLNTGGVIKGKIIENDDSEITVRTKHGQTTISRDDIEKIEECESVAALYYDKLDKLPQGEAKSHLDLARWLARINEPDLARDEFEKTIIIDPDNPAARKELGYVRKGDSWVRKDAKPKALRVVVGKKKKKEEDGPADEHNLLSGASAEAKKLVKALDSTSKSQREEALRKLEGLYRWGDVQAVGEYMRYREARLITSLQRHEGEILNLLHGQLDEDLRERQVRWFERYQNSSTMRERLHNWKTLGMLVDRELENLKKLGAERADKALKKHAGLLELIGETSGWLKAKKEFTTEFGTCLTDIYHAVLLARAGREKDLSRYTSKLDAFDSFIVRNVLSWHLEDKSKAYVPEMLSLVNSLRTSKGLGKLETNDVASKAAMGHARDMYVNRFFSHTSPTFGTPAYRLQRLYSIRVNWKTETEGELISKRSALPDAVFNDWLRNEKDKLLDKDWKSVGIGSLGDYWVVIFVK